MSTGTVRRPCRGQLAHFVVRVKGGGFVRIKLKDKIGNKKKTEHKEENERVQRTRTPQ